MPTPSFFGGSFKNIDPSKTNDSKNETLGQGATFAFGPKKKYYFLKKLQPKTFLSPKSIHRFSNNKVFDFFPKNFPKYFLKIDLWFLGTKKCLALTFLKINIFSSVQKQKLRLAPKFHFCYRSSPTDQYPWSYPQKTVGG